jgi:hypothetical protein
MIVLPIGDLGCRRELGNSPDPRKSASPSGWQHPEGKRPVRHEQSLDRPRRLVHSRQTMFNAHETAVAGLSSVVHLTGLRRSERLRVAGVI